MLNINTDSKRDVSNFAEDEGVEIEPTKEEINKIIKKAPGEDNINAVYIHAVAKKRKRRKRRVENFKYLGSTITVTYGSETWTISEQVENMLNTIERKIFRKIYFPVKDNEWRSRTNLEIYEIYEEPNITADIKMNTLSIQGQIMLISTSLLFKNPVFLSGILVIEVLAYSSYGIFVNLSRIDGIVQYKSSSLVLQLEVIKFLISLVLLWPEKEKINKLNLRIKSIIPFSLPAICYCINNNLAVNMQDHMDPATFQVLCNLKTVSTAILYRIIIKRKLKLLQWLSLALLTAAGMLNSYAGLSDEPRTLTQVYVSPVGLVLTLIYCFLSGLAGVYTEYILKKDQKASLSLQNCYLYIFGILFNLIIWCFQNDKKESLFQGFTLFTWLLLLSQAVNGLIMSLIMKYSSNIVRLFVISSALPVTTLLASFIFNFQPGLELYVTVVSIIISIFLYTI
ncbi:hypothetical protein Btru_059616 [Bulinus truncatus]|nr:hypothetical protein Btru_059616 [Bulinus truncatus]